MQLKSDKNRIKQKIHLASQFARWIFHSKLLLTTLLALRMLLNHKLSTILDVNTLGRNCYLTTLQIINRSQLIIFTLYDVAYAG